MTHRNYFCDKQNMILKFLLRLTVFFLSLMSAMEIALQHIKLILLESIEKDAHTSCHFKC